MLRASLLQIMANRIDRRLNNLFGELAARLGGSSDASIYFGGDEADNLVELAEPLAAVGLLSPAEPASATICDGCERNCIMPVDIAPAIHARPSRAFIVCDKRDDIGRVSVDMSRLHRWTFSFPLIAGAVAKALQTDREPSEEEAADAWRLGNAVVGRKTIGVALARSVHTRPSDAGLTIVLGQVSSGMSSDRTIALTKAFGFSDGRLVPRMQVLHSALLSGDFDDATVAFAIRFDFGEVVVIDCINGDSRIIAAPQLDSQTYRVFRVLYENPEKIYTVAELEQCTGINVLKSLHKVPENLNFTGARKKLFFEVSRYAILFRRQVTRGQLASHRIDPKAII